MERMKIYGRYWTASKGLLFCTHSWRMNSNWINPEEYADKRFSELDEDIQNTIKNTEIVINVYQDLNEQETEDIFCRLNNGKPLSNDNIYRAHMGDKLRAFVDEAVQKPFMTKINFTKGQLRKSEDEGVVLAALALISDEAVNDLTKQSIIKFIDDFKCNFQQDQCDEILASLDWLDEVIPEKHKNLKKVSMPMIISSAAVCLNDDSKKKLYAEKLTVFLDEYEAREEYLELCKTSTSSATNVCKRIYYFDAMTREE